MDVCGLTQRKNGIDVERNSHIYNSVYQWNFTTIAQKFYINLKESDTNMVRRVGGGLEVYVWGRFGWEVWRRSSGVIRRRFGGEDWKK